MTDATACLDSWPGAARAAIIVSRHAAAHGDHERAISIVEAARAESPTLPRTRCHQLATIASAAHLSGGDLARSVSEAAEIVDDGGTLEHWDRLLQAAEEDMESLALVLGLALLGDEEAFIDAVARAVSPSRTAEICGTYLALGGTNPDAVSTGLLAAVLSGQTELADVIAKHGQLLPAEIRARLAEHLTSADSPDLAIQLMAEHASHAA